MMFRLVYHSYSLPEGHPEDVCKYKHVNRNNRFLGLQARGWSDKICERNLTWCRGILTYNQLPSLIQKEKLYPRLLHTNIVPKVYFPFSQVLKHFNKCHLPIMAERSWGIKSLSSKWQSSSLRVELWGCETCGSSPKSSRLNWSKLSSSVKEWHNDMDLMVESAWSLLHALLPQTEQQDIDLEEYVVVEATPFDFFADFLLELFILKRKEILKCRVSCPQTQHRVERINHEATLPLLKENWQLGSSSV